METACMKALIRIAALLIATTGAQASEVYKTTDAQGRPVYTDKPPTLPAERLKVQSATTDTVDVQKRKEAEAQRLAEKEAGDKKAADTSAKERAANELSAEDRAKRCQQARERYDNVSGHVRLYEPGPTEGERRYLSAEEIDAARASAKQVMEEFCGKQ
jgi:hypothetical protein